MIFASLWQRLYLWFNRWWLRLRGNAPADSAHGGPPAHWLADVARVSDDAALISQAPSAHNIPTPLRQFTRQPHSYAHRHSSTRPPAHWLAHATRIRRGEPAVVHEHITTSSRIIPQLHDENNVLQKRLIKNAAKQTQQKTGQWKLPQKTNVPSQIQIESSRTRRIVRVRLRQPRKAVTQERRATKNILPLENSRNSDNKIEHIANDAHHKNEHVISDYVQKVSTTSIIRIPRPVKLPQQIIVISRDESHNHGRQLSSSVPTPAITPAINSAHYETAAINNPRTYTPSHTGDDNTLRDQKATLNNNPLQNVNTETQSPFIAPPELQKSHPITAPKPIRRAIFSWWKKIIPTWFVSERPHSSNRQFIHTTHPSQPHVASNAHPTFEQSPQLNSITVPQTDHQCSPNVVNGATTQQNSHVASAWPQLPEADEIDVSTSTSIATRHPLPEHAWNV